MLIISGLGIISQFDESDISVSGESTLYVGPSETYNTITAAIIAANPGDTMLVYQRTLRQRF